VCRHRGVEDMVKGEKTVYGSIRGFTPQKRNESEGHKSLI